MEFRSSCLHINYYPGYLPAPALAFPSSQREDPLELTWRLGSSSRKMKGLWNCLCKAALIVIFTDLYLSCTTRAFFRGSSGSPCSLSGSPRWETPPQPPPPSLPVLLEGLTYCFQGPQPQVPHQVEAGLLVGGEPQVADDGDHVGVAVILEERCVCVCVGGVSMGWRAGPVAWNGSGSSDHWTGLRLDHLGKESRWQGQG